MKACLAGSVFGVHPTSRGFGWVVFEHADLPVHWGIASAKEGRNQRLIRRFERLLSRNHPSVLVLEEFDGIGPRRVQRIKALCRSFVQIASARGLDVVIYRRDVVARSLGLGPDASRHDVATTVAARLDAFDHRFPPKRKPWEAEDPRQSLFDAAALALTHFVALGVPPPPAHSGAPE